MECRKFCSATIIDAKSRYVMKSRNFVLQKENFRAADVQNGSRLFIIRLDEQE